MGALVDVGSVQKSNCNTVTIHLGVEGGTMTDACATAKYSYSVPGNIRENTRILDLAQISKQAFFLQRQSLNKHLLFSSMFISRYWVCEKFSEWCFVR